jgi:hypothetical protein
MTDEQRAGILGAPLVQAIDAYFDARERYILAMQAGDYDAARAAERDSKAALSNWMSLLVNRVDSRTSKLLVDVLQRVENIEALADRVTALEQRELGG